MKKTKTYFYIIALLPLFLNTLYAQQNASLNEGTINDRLEHLINQSNSYQEYKVIRKDWLDSFQKSLSRTITSFEEELKSKNETISKQQEQIALLQKQLAESEEKLNASLEEKNAISFLGIVFNKEAFKGFFWTVSGILAILLLLFVYRFNNANRITREARINLQNLEQEFEEHKRRALEREQKVRRQLQDEINKQKKLTKAS